MYQTIHIIGRLGRDPESKFTAGGDAVTSFSVATDRSYNDRSGQRQKETTWFRVSIFGKQAEACNRFLKKGSLVLVEGRLTVDPQTGGPRIYQTKDGNSASSFEITASDVRFLGGTEQQADATPATAPAPVKATPAKPSAPLSDDDLTF